MKSLDEMEKEMDGLVSLLTKEKKQEWATEDYFYEGFDIKEKIKTHGHPCTMVNIVTENLAIQHNLNEDELYDLNMGIYNSLFVESRLKMNAVSVMIDQYKEPIVNLMETNGDYGNFVKSIIDRFFILVERILTKSVNWVGEDPYFKRNESEIHDSMKVTMTFLKSEVERFFEILKDEDFPVAEVCS